MRKIDHDGSPPLPLTWVGQRARARGTHAASGHGGGADPSPRQVRRLETGDWGLDTGCIQQASHAWLGLSLRQELETLTQQTTSQHGSLTAAFETELAGLRRDVAQARADVDVQVQAAQQAQAELSAATEAAQGLLAQVAELESAKVRQSRADVRACLLELAPAKPPASADSSSFSL